MSASLEEMQKAWRAEQAQRQLSRLERRRKRPATAPLTDAQIAAITLKAWA